jgi:hypothetical protein
MGKLNRVYLISTTAFMLVLPLASIFVAGANGHSDGWSLIGRWFVFWTIGVRLFVAGIRQAAQPAFTAEHIFGIRSAESHPVVRELGFSNICFGLMGIASLFLPSWLPAAAFGGGLYFGLAGTMHVVKGTASANERFAMITDLLFFALIAGWFGHLVIAR